MNVIEEHASYFIGAEYLIVLIILLILWLMNDFQLVRQIRAISIIFSGPAIAAVYYVYCYTDKQPVGIGLMIWTFVVLAFIAIMWLHSLQYLFNQIATEKRQIQLFPKYSYLIAIGYFLGFMLATGVLAIYMGLHHTGWIEHYDKMHETFRDISDEMTTTLQDINRRKENIPEDDLERLRHYRPLTTPKTWKSPLFKPKTQRRIPHSARKPKRRLESPNRGRFERSYSESRLIDY